MLDSQDSVQWIPPRGPGSTPTLNYSFQKSGSNLKHVTIDVSCPEQGESEGFDFYRESPMNTCNLN